MNDLLKGSSEFSRQDMAQVQEIKKQYEKLEKHLKKLQGAHEETKAVTKAPSMKSIKQRMERDVDEVGRISRFYKYNDLPIHGRTG